MTNYNDGCILTCLIALIIIIGANLIVAWIVMLLWNWLIPIFWTDGPQLTILQTLGAIMLLTILKYILFNRSSNRK